MQVKKAIQSAKAIVKSISLNKIIKCKYNKQINIGDSVSAMKHLHTWYIV